MPGLRRSGSSTSPGGSSTSPEGSSTSPWGSSTSPEGSSTSPRGSSTSPRGSSTFPRGSPTSPRGSSTSPGGSSTSLRGSSTSSRGSSTSPGGRWAAHPPRGTFRGRGGEVDCAAAGEKRFRSRRVLPQALQAAPPSSSIIPSTEVIASAARCSRRISPDRSLPRRSRWRRSQRRLIPISGSPILEGVWKVIKETRPASTVYWRVKSWFQQASDDLPFRVTEFVHPWTHLNALLDAF